MITSREFRSSMKEVFDRVSKEGSVIIVNKGIKYELKLLSSFAPKEVKVVNKDNVKEVVNGIKLDKIYVDNLEEDAVSDLNKFYSCGHQRFPLAQFCRKCS